MDLKGNDEADVAKRSVREKGEENAKATARNDANTSERPRRRRRRRRKKKTIDNGPEISVPTHLPPRRPLSPPEEKKNLKKTCDEEEKDNATAGETPEKKKKHKGPRKRRRKKKKNKGDQDVEGSPFDDLLRVASQLQQRQSQSGYPAWLQLDRGSHERGTSSTRRSIGSKASSDGMSWLAQRAAIAGMGITPIETIQPPNRVRRVASWGRHTTKFDPIYISRESVQTTTVPTVRQSRPTATNAQESINVPPTTSTVFDSNAKRDDVDVSNSFDQTKIATRPRRTTNTSSTSTKNDALSSHHLEQIFSPSWGAETEAWQRERLKQWVIWAEEQERKTRVQETYVGGDTGYSSNRPMDYEIVCPYIAFGCTCTTTREQLSAHLATCKYRTLDKVPMSPVEHDESYEVMCPYAFLGCEVSCGRDKIEDHIKSCSYRYDRRPRRNSSMESMLPSIDMRGRYAMMLLQLSLEIVKFAEDCKRSDEIVGEVVDASLCIVRDAAARSLRRRESTESAESSSSSSSHRVRALLFGSRAMGLALPQSDIDIVIDWSGVLSSSRPRSGSRSDASLIEADASSDVSFSSIARGEESLQKLAEQLKGDNQKWLEWIKVISSTVPVIKLCASPRSLIRRSRGEYAQTQVLSDVESNLIDVKQNQLRTMMDRLLGLRVFDVESTEELAKIAQELVHLQRRVVARSESLSHTQVDDDRDSETDSGARRHLVGPPSSPLPMNASEAVEMDAFPDRMLIDVTLKTHMGVETVSFVRSLVAYFPELRPLVLVIKQLLRTIRLNDPYTGGLSSYALVIMTAALLQRRASDDVVEDEDTRASDVSKPPSPPSSSSLSSHRTRDVDDSEVAEKNSTEEEEEVEDSGDDGRFRSVSLGSLNGLLEDTSDVPARTRRMTEVSNSSQDPLRLGEILLDFLQVYGPEFNAGKNSISLDLGALEGFERFEKMATSRVSGMSSKKRSTSTEKIGEPHRPPVGRFGNAVMLQVWDPLQPENNVTRTCFAYSQIQHAFTQVLIQILLLGKNTTHVGGESLLQSAGFVRGN